MADTPRPPGQQRLLIKVIMPKQGTERKVPDGGTPTRPFRTVDAKYRSRLSSQVTAIRTAIAPQIKTAGAAPVRVKLLSKAVAKSHRPERLFSPQSCPIVGGGSLGELFVKATLEGLDRLGKIIDDNRSDQITKELSCVEMIEPVTPVYRRSRLDAEEVLQRSPRGKHGFITRVRLFNFGADRGQPKLVEDFKITCRKRGITVRSNRGYLPSSFTYEIECRDVEDVEVLSNIVGVRSIAPMPLIRTIRPRTFAAKPLPPLPKADNVTGDFPVVVVVDSGISDKNPGLESWVVGRDSYVAPRYRNTDHGSFVAGLICWGRQLNPTIAGLDNNPCGVFDLQVIPNDDPAKGATLPLLESEFLVSLEEALQQHANKFKVWNLSLGTDTVCALDRFSKLAEELDNLQERYQVSFVISAGNYYNPPLLDFPRAGGQLQAGRDHHARRQRPRDHRGRGVAYRLQKQRAERASPVCFLSARRGTELCNQARPSSLRWIMFHGPCAYCRDSFGERDRLGRESRDEFCNAAGGTHARADLSPSHAYAVSRTGESVAHAPCARPTNVVARAGRRRKLLRLRATCDGAVLSGMLASHIHAGFRRRAATGLLPRMEWLPVSALAESEREIFRRSLDDGGLCTCAR